MQIAGQTCQACGDTLVMATEGTVCAACGEVVCDACCEATGNCPSCGEPISNPESKPRPGNPIRAPKRSLQTLGPKGGKRPPSPGLTRAEYLRAKRHNGFRWSLAMGIRIPLFAILLVTVGALAAGVVSVFVMPAIYGIATKAFPGSAVHGSVLYQKAAKKYRREASTGKPE